MNSMQKSKGLYKGCNGAWVKGWIKGKILGVNIKGNTNNTLHEVKLLLSFTCIAGFQEC